MSARYASLAARLLANSVPAPCPKPELGPCWLWIARRNNQGYGVLSRRTPTGLHYKDFAHRASLEAFRGVKLSPGKAGGRRKKGLHLCNVRPCICPDHLKPGTLTENNRQTVAEGRRRPRA